MLRIPLHLAGKERESEDLSTLDDVAGVPLATVSQAPPLLVRRLIGDLRGLPVPESRPAALARAAELFATGELDGETPQDYCRGFARATGIPVRVAERACGQLRDLAASLEPAAPQEFAFEGAYAKVHRVPRGEVFGVIAPSNHPATHGSWLHAIAYGMRLVIRPGGRDPFTPLRLARAISAAFDGSYPLHVLNGPHRMVETVVEASDLALVYGGPAAITPFAGRDDVALRGPGRTKAILSGPATGAQLDLLAAAIADDAGVRCTNVSAVLTDQPPAEIAEAIAERLAGLPVHPPEHPQAVLPVLPSSQAEALAKQVAAMAESGRRHGPAICADLGDGSTALRPSVVSVDHSNPFLGTEMCFPFVMVGPWRTEDGLAPARDSLALVLLGEAEKLAEQALMDPSIRRVVVGPVLPWFGAPFLPHDGDLRDFLLEAKAVVTRQPEQR